MGLLDKVKGMVSGNKDKSKQGVDTAADQAKKVAPDEQDEKVDQAADAAKDQIDKLD
jgi:MT0933-like antitoxin protein